MSRHDLDPLNPPHEVVVGWDPPLQTFFAQVLDTAADEDSDVFTLVWIGTSFREVRCIDIILAAVRPYARIPDHLADDLIKDFIANQ